MRKIKALVFDFDGLILDTESPELNAWREVYRIFGYEFPVEKYLLTVGTDQSAFKPAAYLCNLAGDTSLIDEIFEKQKRLLGEYLSASDLMPGVRNYLETADYLGLKTSIASSSNDKWVYDNLSRLQCNHLFDTVVTAGNIYPPKPDPTVYSIAMERLGVDSQETIAFEDSLNGVRAAKRADIYCVAVPNAVTANMDFSEANLQVGSLLSLSPQELIKIVEAN